AGLAQGFAREGWRVRLERAGAGEAARADAALFGEYLFASSSGTPVASAPEAAADEVLIVELDAGAPPEAGLPAIVAVYGEPAEGDKQLAAELGNRLVGTIAVAVAPERVEEVARELTNGDLRPLTVVTEDLRLTAPSVAELAAALDAR